MPSDDHTAVPLVGWPSLTEVRLYDETLPHIALHAEFEMELPSQRTGLLIGIGQPSAIYESRTQKNSVVLVSHAFTYFGDPLHVPVRLIGGTTSGRVTTAYFSDTTYKGTKLWEAGHE